ncbi:MAG: hypothetical protein GY850_01885, partial [bacterium]|nr:hypothetical protein [bacterium]
NSIDNQFPETHMAMLRGLTGDVLIHTNALGDLDYQKVPACENGPGLNTVTIDDFLNGNIRKRVSGSVSCVPMNALTINGTSYTNLRDYYFQTIKAIADNIVAQTPLTSGQITFLNTIPAPLSTVIKQLTVLLKNSSNTPDTNQIAIQFVDYCAKNHIYRMINDFCSQMNQIIIRGLDALDNYKGASDGDQRGCE